MNTNASWRQQNNEWYAENVELGVIFILLRFLESADGEWKMGIFTWVEGRNIIKVSKDIVGTVNRCTLFKNKCFKSE